MRLALLAVLMLAACGSPPPRAPVAGQQSRAEVDAATKVYSDCVDSRAATVDVSGAMPGDVVDAIVKVCQPARAALVSKVAAFHKLGHPKLRPDQLAIVGEESVKDIDAPIAADAVVKVVERQQAAAKSGK